MIKVNLLPDQTQAKLDSKIRRICRNALIGKISTSAPNIGFNSATLWNQLTDGRIKWIPAVTVALICKYTGCVDALDRLCREAGHHAMPLPNSNPVKKEKETTDIASDVLKKMGELLVNRKQRPKVGAEIMRAVYYLSNK